MYSMCTKNNNINKITRRTTKWPDSVWTVPRWGRSACKTHADATTKYQKVVVLLRRGILTGVLKDYWVPPGFILKSDWFPFQIKVESN